MRNFYKLIIAAILTVVSADAYCESAIYACGHIRRERETAIDNLKSAGYTTAIIFSFDVQPDGSITTDFNWSTQTQAEAGGIICQDGKYVFDEYQPNFASDIESLLVPPTSINRLELCIGGWGCASYGSIKTCIDKYGTGPETVLYQNFKALKEAIPSIEAVNNDQEQDYDLNTAVAFHKMLAEIGYKTTIAPYTMKQFWQQLVAKLNEEIPGVVDRVYLQTYGGGESNTPNSWNVFGDVPMLVGYDCEATDNIPVMEVLFKNWLKSSLVKGGFIWNYNSEKRNQNQWASAVNRLVGTKTADNPAVTVYGGENYKGYAVGLPEGEFTQIEMALYGIPANSIMSVKPEEGYQITIYAGKNLDGESETYTEDIYNLGNEWGAKACSVKIEKAPAGVDCINVDEGGASYYTLSGLKVSEPQKGIHIKVVDGKATKIVRDF